MHIKGRVEGGRLKVDAPVDLPEGSEATLDVVGIGDDLDDAERAELHRLLG